MSKNINVKRFLISGGAGFIGSTVVRNIINNTNHIVINLDKLTYAGNLESLQSIEGNNRYLFERIDICDINEIKRVFNKYQPDIVNAISLVCTVSFVLAGHILDNSKFNQ